MDPNQIITTITNSFAVIASIIAIIISIKKTPHETVALDAGAAESSAQAVALYSAELVTMKKRLDEVNVELAAMCAELNTIKMDNAVLREHNTRLSAQVISLGGTPVKMPQTAS